MMGSPITKEILTEDEVLNLSAVKRPVLSLMDRCDRCGSQAFAAAHHVRGISLLFCGHHFAKHEAGLVGAGFEVQDERDRINRKPSVSANVD